MVQSVATSSKNSADILTVLESSSDLGQTVSGREEFQSQLSSASNSIEQRTYSGVNDSGIKKQSVEDKPGGNEPNSDASDAPSFSTGGKKKPNEATAEKLSNTNLQATTLDTQTEEVSNEQTLVFVNQDVIQADAEELLNLFSKIKNNNNLEFGDTNEQENKPSFVQSLQGVLEGDKETPTIQNNDLFSEIATETTDQDLSVKIVSDSDSDSDSDSGGEVQLSQILPDDVVVTHSAIETDPLVDGVEASDDEKTLTNGIASVSSFNTGANTRNLVEEFVQPDEASADTQYSKSNSNSVSDSSLSLGTAGEHDSLSQALTILLSEGEDKVQDVAAQLGLVVSQNAGASQAVAKEVTGTLKAVVSEISTQLQKGHDLNINLSDIAASVSERLSVGVANGQVSPEQLTSLVQQVPAAINSVIQTLPDPESLSHRIGLDTQIASETVQTQTESTKLSPATHTNEKGVALGRTEAAQQLADKVQVIVNQKNLTAEIKLDPQELGALQVRVQLNGDQAQVNFTVQNQSTRDLLEQAVPRLRELLQDKGIELGQSNVRQEHQERQGQDSDNQSGRFADESGSSAVSADEVIETKVVNGHLGAIDYFA